MGLAVAMVSVAAHLPALRGGLVWDDAGTIPPTGSVLAAFGRSFWPAGQGRTQYYRPLTTLSLAIDRYVGGGRAWWFHLTNILLHGMVVLLLYRLLFLLGGSMTAAALATLVFGVHRLTADSVAYVSGRTDILAGLGLLIGLNALLQSTVGQQETAQLRIRHLWLVLAGFLVAVGAKESSLVFPVVVSGWLAGNRQLRRNWLLVAGLLVITGLYLFGRARVLGGLLNMEMAPAGSMLGVSLNSSGYLLLETLLPLNTRLFLWRPGELTSLTGWAVPAVLFLLLPVVLWYRSAPLWGLKMLLMWGWSVLFLFPFAGVLQFGPIGRFFYIPGFGLIALAVLAGLRFAASQQRAQVLVAVAAGWCGLMVPWLWQRTGWWQSDQAVFSRMTKDARTYAPGFYNLGNALVKSGDTLAAVAAYQRAVELDSGLISASLNLGALLLARRELEQAVQVYRSVMRHSPEYAPAYVNLGIVLYRLGDQSAAIEALRQAARLDPNSASAAHNLSRLFWLSGETDSARAWAERARARARQSGN